MNGTQVATHETETRNATMFGVTGLEGFGAIATIALAIVGLVGIFSATMAAIATIVVGAAALVEGGALGMRSNLRFANVGGFNLSRSSSLDFQGGLATVVLGILALLGLAPTTLIAVAVLALGATFLFSGRVLIGLAAVVLGILAVVGLSPMVLSLVGLLILGAGSLFSGAQIAAETTETAPQAG